MVMVLSNNGSPLAPTTRHGKIRHLLKNKQAIVVSNTPFTVQLLYDCDATHSENTILKISNNKET